MDRLEPIKPGTDLVPRLGGAGGLPAITPDQRRRQQEQRQRARQQYERTQSDDEDEYYEGERQASDGEAPWDPRFDPDRRRAGRDDGDPDQPGPHIDISA